MPALLFLAVTLVSLVAAPVFAAEPEIPAKPEGSDSTPYDVERRGRQRELRELQKRPRLAGRP
jgi:hypothetical protein